MLAMVPALCPPRVPPFRPGGGHKEQTATWGEVATLVWWIQQHPFQGRWGTATALINSSNFNTCSQQQQSLHLFTGLPGWVSSVLYALLRGCRLYIFSCNCMSNAVHNFSQHQPPQRKLLFIQRVNYFQTGNSLAELDLPMSASERWMGFFVWCRCFLKRTKLIFSRSSGEIMPSSICRSIMSSAGNTVENMGSVVVWNHVAKEESCLRQDCMFCCDDWCVTAEVEAMEK